MSDIKTVRCTYCAAEFTDEEVKGVTCCPVCKSAGIPCDIADDVTIKVNWHELRILGIWASNFCSAPNFPEESKEVVTKILQRIEAQYPDKTPLSLAGEVRQLQEEYPGAGLYREDGTPLVPPKKVQ